MNNFNLNASLREAYSSFPEATHRPVIGITANYEGIDATLRHAYYDQVVAAGGTPVIIPPVADKDVIVNTGLGIGDRIVSVGANNVQDGQQVLFSSNEETKE